MSTHIGLYKIEFRILEIRISGETNLKKHFYRVIGFEKKNRKEWCVLHNFKQPNFGRKKRLNFGFRHIEDLFFFGDHLILGGKNCIVTVCHELF